MRVELCAQPTLYEPRGEFQLGVEVMRRAGLGALYEAYARLKERLQSEGLFDAARKRPLPAYPRQIGIITSLKAAALRDVLTTLARRWPLAGVDPTPVQGEGAAESIAAALRTAGARAECDVLLLVRGRQHRGPVVFQRGSRRPGDRRKPHPHRLQGRPRDRFHHRRLRRRPARPTPTGAAQLATPDAEELRQHLHHLARRLTLDQQRRLHTLAQRLDGLAQRLRHPAEQLANRRWHLDQLTRRLALAQAGRLALARQRLSYLRARFQRAQPEPARLQARVSELQGRLKRAFASSMQQRQARVI